MQQELTRLGPYPGELCQLLCTYFHFNLKLPRNGHIIISHMTNWTVRELGLEARAPPHCCQAWQGIREGFLFKAKLGKHHFKCKALKREAY